MHEGGRSVRYFLVNGCGRCSFRERCANRMTNSIFLLSFYLGHVHVHVLGNSIRRVSVTDICWCFVHYVVVVLPI